MQSPATMKLWFFMFLAASLSSRTVAVPPDMEHTSLSNTDTTTARLYWQGKLGDFDHYRLSIVPSAGVTISRPLIIPSVEIRGYIYFSNLTPMTQYNISIRTVDKNGVEGRPLTKTITTSTLPETTKITVSSITTTGAVVTWSKLAGKIDYYQITCSESFCYFNSDYCSISCPVPRPNVSASDSNLQTSVTFRTPGGYYYVDLFTVYNNIKTYHATNRFYAKPPAVNQTSISVTNISTASATVKWDTVYAVIGGQRQELLGISNCYPGKGNYSIGVKKAGTSASGIHIETRATSFDINDLIPGTDYTITIKTQCVIAGDEVSKEFSTAPADIVISAISRTNAVASWSKSAGKFDYYHISIQETYWHPNVTVASSYSRSSYRGETTDPTSVPSSAESPSVRLVNLTPYSTYRVFVWTVNGTTKGPIRSSLYFKTALDPVSGDGNLHNASGSSPVPGNRPDGVSASDSSTGVAVSALVFALIAIIVIVVIVIIHRRNAGDKAAAASNGIEVSNKPVARHNKAYEADQEPSQAVAGNNEISEISEFRKWLLTQQVTEATYATLEKEGLHDPGIFTNMKPDQVAQLSIKPLGQAFLIQKIADGFNLGKSPFLARNRGNMSDSIYDDVESNFNPYAQLQFT